MLISSGDMLLSALFIIGLFQLFWLSVVLVRKGLNPSLIRLCLTVLFSIWLLMWPAYEDSRVILASLALLVLPIILSFRQNKPYARHLKLAWHSVPQGSSEPAPWLMVLLSLWIAAQLFHYAPELGLGVALSLSVGWSLAELLDKSKRGLRLGLKMHPRQTLAGHLFLVLVVSFACVWSLQLYHGLPWQQFYVATMIAGLMASAVRALLMKGWNMPLSVLAMSAVLWLL
ncbi:MAG: hypothetical protein Q9M19_08035 [Mariprofundaceae bacterium]|nr:hypothetical protein [Mariprofundaceae bacterium]